MSTSCSTESPPTERSPVISTFALGTNTLPVPLARNSKSAFETVVSIKLFVILMSPMSAPFAYNHFHILLSAPKLYAVSMFGIRSLSIPATICIVSLASSPIVMLPPMVTLPVTSKLPATFTSLFKFNVCVSGLILILPAKLSIVFPLILKLPVSILSPLTKVELPPLVNVTPCVKSTLSAFATKFTVPSSWFT